MFLAINSGVTTKRNSSLIYLTCVLGCLVFVLLVVNVYFSMLVGIGHASNAADKPDEPKKKGVTIRPVCTTRECVEISANVIGKMDSSVNPCEDMYQFSCGQYNSKETTKSNIQYSEVSFNRFKDDVSKILSSSDTRLYGRESRALAKMKKYQRLCTDERNNSVNLKSKILQLISDAGFWTLTDNGVKPFESSTWSLQRTLIKIHKMALWPLFNVDVLKRWREAGRPTPENFIDLNIRESSSSFENGVYDERKIEELALLPVVLGGDLVTVKQKIKQVLEFSGKLQKAKNAPFPKAHEFHPSQMISIKSLQGKLGSWLNLKEYLSDMFDGAVFADDMLLVVQPLQYFIDVQTILEKCDKEVQANYLVLWLLHALEDIMPASWQIRNVVSRERRCTENTLNLFGVAAVATYVEHVFKHENKATVNIVAQNIKQQMLATIDRTTWLEEPLRTRLLEKAQRIQFFYGYPDWILNATSLDSYYANFEVIDDELLNATITAMKELMKKIYKKDLPETLQLITRVQRDSIAYFAYSNTVIVHVNQLQQPLFEPSFSKPFIYGGLGNIFGHEITHAFDVQVRKWDENAFPMIIWPLRSDEEYLKRAKCLADQYSSQTLYGVHLRGNNTGQEDISDNNGVRLAYKAFKAHALSSDPILPGLNLTDDQMFFLGFSQKSCQKISEADATFMLLYLSNSITHSPYSYRVNMTLSNYPEFAKAFNCPLGSPMNPVKKCAVWE